mmetsp:Transcript_35957/g.66699  ORF Transcript_35957/g.66699 Transcript_35957/m.66699 type:complete len:245 (+) Transcript_35957:96-830(+)
MPLKQSKTTPRMTSATAAALARSKEVIDNGGTQAEAVAAAKEAVRNTLREQREQHQEREQQLEQQRRALELKIKPAAFSRVEVPRSQRRVVVPATVARESKAVPITNERRDDDDDDDENTLKIRNEPNLHNSQEEQWQGSWLHFLCTGPCTEDNSLCGDGGDSVCFSEGNNLVIDLAPGNGYGGNDLDRSNIDSQRHRMSKNKLIKANAITTAGDGNKSKRHDRSKKWNSHNKSISWADSIDYR